MPDGPVSIYSEFVEAPVAVLWRFFDDREPEPIMGYRYINNLSKAKPIDHGEAHVLDVSPSVLSKGKPIDHGAVEVITPEIMPMMAARMIDHGAVSVLDVELDRIVEPEPVGLDVLLGIYYESGRWYSEYPVKIFDRYGMPLTQTDADKLIAYGLTLSAYTSPYGTIDWTTDYTFEVLGVYSDLNGEIPFGLSADNFYCGPNSSNPQFLGIHPRVNDYSHGMYMSWRCRIIKNI
jgi:hypothetical protein